MANDQVGGTEVRKDLPVVSKEGLGHKNAGTVPSDLGVLAYTLGTYTLGACVPEDLRPVSISTSCESLRTLSEEKDITSRLTKKVRLINYRSNLKVPLLLRDWSL